MLATYNMVTHQQKRSPESNQTMKWLQKQEWGCIVFDEVHTIPAHIIRRVRTIVQAHVFLGLSATSVSENGTRLPKS